MEGRKQQQNKSTLQANKLQMRQEKRVSDKETDLREKQMEIWITNTVSLFKNRVQFRDEVQTLI